jgi:hypothetical protein
VAASDQYALAVMTYQLLTGSLPFQGRQEQVMYQHFHIEPQPPSARNRRISKEVDSIILRGLSKKPEERFPSIADFSSALQQAITTPESSKAAPPVASGALPRPTNPLPYSEGDMRATVAISSQEATTGTTRTLNLPGGRRITVPIPSGLPDGQVIRLENQGETTSDGTTGALVLKIAVAPEQTSLAAQRGNENKTVRSDPQVVRRQMAEKQPSQARRLRFVPRGRAAIIVGLVVLIVLASSGVLLTRSFQNSNPPYATGTLALNDPLSDNSQGNAWDEVSGSCVFSSGEYKVSSQAGLQPCLARNSNFGDMAYEVQVTIVQGEEAGIIFRADGSQQNYYFFYVDADGVYDLDSYANTIATTKTAGANTAIKIGTNVSNVLGVVTSNNQIDLYVNYQKVDSVMDSTYSQGEIGVAAYSYVNATQAVFSNARVWIL